MKVNVRVRLADFGVKDLDQMEGRDGVIYRAALTYKGRVFCHLFDEGHGGAPYITFVELVDMGILGKMYDVLYNISAAIKANLNIQKTVLDVVCLDSCKKGALTQFNYQNLAQNLFELICEFDEVIRTGKQFNYKNNVCTIICMSNFSLLNRVDSRDNAIYENVMRTITYPLTISELSGEEVKRLLNKLAVRTAAKGAKLLYCLEYNKQNDGKLIRYSLADIVKGIQLAGQLNNCCGV